MNPRVREEIDLVRQKYPDMQHDDAGVWLHFPEYPLPNGRYKTAQTRLAIVIPPGYPITPIDNVFVEAGLRLSDGALPPAYQEGNLPINPFPLPGSWGWFSWHPQPNEWRPAATVQGGDNLLTFLRAVNMCLRGEEV